MLVQKKALRGLILTGIAALAAILFTLFRLIVFLDETKAELARSTNMFKGLGEAMLSTVQIQWGWAVLLAAAVLLMIAGFWKSSVKDLWRQHRWIVIASPPFWD